MTWYNILTLVISISALPTLVGLVWKDLHDRKKEKSKEAKEKKKQEFQDNVTEVMQIVLKPTNDKLSNIDKKLDLVSEGTLSSLRNDILKDYYACVAKGYRNDYDFKNVHDLYEAYVALDGNSFIEDIMNRFDGLPTKEDYDKKIAEEKKQKNTRSKNVQGNKE